MENYNEPINKVSAADLYLDALQKLSGANTEALAQSLLLAATKGDMVALKEINERILGKNNSQASGDDVIVNISNERTNEIVSAWQDTMSYFDKHGFQLPQ